MYSTANIDLIKCFQCVLIFSSCALFPVLLVILQQPQLLTGHRQEQVCVFTWFGSLLSYKQRYLNVWDITTVELMTVEKFKTVLVHSFTLPPRLCSICSWPWNPLCFKSPSSCHRRITFWPLRLKPRGPVVSRLFWWWFLDLLITAPTSTDATTNTDVLCTFN